MFHPIESSFNPYRTVLYSTVLYCTVLYCTVLHCTVLHCTVQYCTVLYLAVLSSFYLFLYNVLFLCLSFTLSASTSAAPHLSPFSSLSSFFFFLLSPLYSLLSSLFFLCSSRLRPLQTKMMCRTSSEKGNFALRTM